MNLTMLLQLPFHGNGAWHELQCRQLSIPLLAWALVLPLSLLPPVLLYYAGSHYDEHFMAGFAGKEWRFITTILFLAELLTFFVMGWLIHSVVAGKDTAINYADAYLIAAIAPVPLWLSSLALLVPSLAFNVVVVFIAMGLSCTLIYHGLNALSNRPDTDVEAMSAAYTVMAASFLAWALLMVMVWAF